MTEIVTGDPTHEAFVQSGPEHGRRVRWMGMPEVYVPALPPVLGVMPTWDELNVPMCYHKYVLEGAIYQWAGRVNHEFNPIVEFPWEN